METDSLDDQQRAGLRLKAVREELGDTQQEMADRVGASFSAYRSYESGERPMRSDQLARLAQQGIDINWLLLGVGEMRRRTLQSAHGMSEAARAWPAHDDDESWVQLRLDLLAPVMQWISHYVTAAGPEIDWNRAADQVIARYTWDYNTWRLLHARPTEPSGGENRG